MRPADLPAIAILDLGGARGPAGWIDWNLSNYAEHGFGLWILETHEGAFVRDCGLTMQEVEGTWRVEAGWHVASGLRRQGYATEAAGAVRTAARDAGIEHLVAIIRPDNVASQRVATKIGLTLEREVHKNGGPALVFGADLNPHGPIASRGLADHLRQDIAKVVQAPLLSGSSGARRRPRWTRGRRSGRPRCGTTARWAG